jgi:phosphatidylglycerol---prolipoprotein diacylglyceryl transferase
VHGFGRIGCFMAGCCYGIPTDRFLGVIFTDEKCQAEPLNTSLHPTQLYEATLIFCIMAALWLFKSRKKFDGQLFLLYLIAYAFGRGLLELFRGDIQRGFIIEDVLSNSQFISMIVISVTIFFYIKLKRNSNLLTRK